MPAQDADREAIIALIHRNRISVWMQDAAAYESCFVHADHTTRWNASRRHGIFTRHGWPDIWARVQRQFEDKSLYRPDLAHETRVERLELQISGDMAWASFEQHYPKAPPGYPGGPEVTHEVRVFERHDGAWRIAFLGFMDEAIGSDLPMLRLASDGKVLWQSEAAPAALAAEDDLVIRDGRLRARNSRIDARLQAALRWAAEHDFLVMTRHGALPIVVAAGEGLPTKVWWVIAESGMILFGFAQTALNKERLAGAAVVYGLSPAQLRVASLVVEGKPLAEIATDMQISANTARTHLNRIYEKTGVRTQPALVRVLLSAVAPL